MNILTYFKLTKISNTIFLKRISLINIIALIVIYLTIISSDCAQEYELNIFAMYSPFFWFIFFATIFVSIIIIVLSEYWRIDNYWRVAFFSLIATYTLFLLLPFFRGYYVYSRGSGDVFAHLSWAVTICNSGNIASYYPISQIFIAILNFMGLKLETATFYIPVIFSICLILFLSIFGLYTKISDNPLFPVIFSLPLLYGTFHHSFHPFIYAIFFIPLVFYLLVNYLQKKEEKRFLILLIIICFFIVFTHPLVTLILIGSLLIYCLISLCVNFANPSKNLFFYPIIRIIAILTVSFCLWYLSFNLTYSGLKSVFSALFDKTIASITIFEHQSFIIETSNVEPIYFIKLFLLNYGPIFSYLILGLLLSIFVFFNIRKLNYNKEIINFCAIFIYGMVLALLFIFKNFILFEPLRAFSFVIIASTMFIPISLPIIFRETIFLPMRKIIYFIITIFIFINVTISLLNIFPSPIISTPSPHMSYMEKNGINWFLDHQVITIPVVSLENSLSYRKYEMYHSKRQILYAPLKIPSHFGYDNYPRINESLDSNDYYYLSTEFDRKKHFAVPEFRRERLPKVTVEDFIRLKRDNSINLLYNNGQFESWYINN